MAVSELDPSKSSSVELLGYVDVRLAALVEMHGEVAPTRDVLLAQLSAGPSPGRRVLHQVAREAGAIVGYALLVLPERENTSVGFVEVAVLAAHRSRGLGSVLLAAARSAAAAAGRDRLVAEGIVAGSRGAAWAEARGFVVGQRMTIQVLAMSDADTARPAPQVHAGYHLVEWVGSAPDGLAVSFVRAKAAMTDAPTGELDIEVPRWDVDRLRRHERELQRRGEQERVVAAVHNATGDVAGLTELRTDSSAMAGQQDTSVVADHRGRGLGLAMKAHQLRLLAANRPDVELVRTHVASENHHMQRINIELGFVTSHDTLLLEARM